MLLLGGAGRRRSGVDPEAGMETGMETGMEVGMEATMEATKATSMETAVDVPAGPGVGPRASVADPAPRTGEGAAAAPDGDIGPGAFSTPVRGHPFAAPPPGVEGPAAGLPARLVREPANPADRHAVAVWVEPDGAPAWRIGYLDRFVASRLAPELDAGAGVTAELDGWIPEPDERWLRPLLRIVPVTGSRSRPTAGERPGADPDGPRLWGRPPGVRRRRLGG